MEEGGLAEVANPSSLFLTSRALMRSVGTAIFPALEGTRPVAGGDPGADGAASEARNPAPGRGRLGFGTAGDDPAVLEARCGLSFATVEFISMWQAISVD